MRNVPKFEVMKGFLLHDGFKQSRPVGVFSAVFSKEVKGKQFVLMISEDCDESAERTVETIKALAWRAGITERGMVSRITRLWAKDHLMRRTSK